MKRMLWEVLPTPRMGWAIICDGIVKETFLFQFMAVAHARALCRATLRDWGIPCELIVKRRDGRIRIKDSYGADPKRTKG